MGTRQETGLLMLCLLLAAAALAARAGSWRAPPARATSCPRPVELVRGERQWLLCRGAGRSPAELLAELGMSACPELRLPLPARSLARVDDRCRVNVRPLPGSHLLLLGLPIDINAAGGDDLEALPGIGPALARRILEERSRRGCFSSPRQLLAVKGIGPVRLERISPYISLGSCTAVLDDPASQTYNAGSTDGVSPGVPDRDPRQDR